jgi:MoaA/NifB/PqqE/SkfB family radical SAM enzyme
MVMDCGAFDSGLTIHPDGKVSPCCLFEKKYFKNLQDINFDDPWYDLRDGKGCNACKHAGHTYKENFDIYKHDNYKVRHLDVRNNNLCNLECTICCSYYSSKWADRLAETKFVSTDFDVDLTNVEHIYFAGGEPLINPKHWQVLDSVTDPNTVTLQYNSNLSTIKNIDIYWPRFKHVSVNASMDAIGPLGEQLRYGTNWDKWTNNLHTAAKYAEVKVNPTISVLNIFNLKEIEEWSDYPITYNILTDPQHLCVSVLPNKLKKSIPYIPDNTQLKSLLNTDDSWLFPHTMSFILLQDKIKNTNIWDSLPFQEYAIQEYMKDGL